MVNFKALTSLEQKLQQTYRILPQDLNLQPLDYQSTAPPFELETMSLCMLNFGYLTPVSYYDVDNNLIVIR